MNLRDQYPRSLPLLQQRSIRRKTMRVSFRLTIGERQAIAKLAAKTGQNPSEIVRLALFELLREQQEAA